MFLISEEEAGQESPYTGLYLLHSWWVLQQVARPQGPAPGLAAWHIFTQALASTSLKKKGAFRLLPQEVCSQQMQSKRPAEAHGQQAAEDRPSSLQLSPGRALQPTADSRQAAPGRWPTLTWRLQPQPSG